MMQLFRQTNTHTTSWSIGCTSFFVGHKVGFWNLPVAIKCQIGNLDATYLALLDTGAEWSVIGREPAIILEDQLGPPTETFLISTRLGKIFGALHRIDIRLLAEQTCGYDLTIESTVFVSEEWEGPIVLGYRGFLERIRFALDPGIVDGEQMFYFGLVE